MTNPLDDLIAGAAAEVVTRPHDREPEPITLGDGEGTVEVTETALEAELAGLESVLTSPEFLQLLDQLSALDVTAGEVDADGHVGRWITEMDSVVDSIRSDATTMATMIRDELIPAVATMRGTLNEVQNARAAADIATAPMAPGVQANAAYEQLRRVQASRGMYAAGPQTAWGEDPQRDMQRAYATIAGLPSAMDHLVTGDYTARAATTATAGAASYPVSPAGQTQVSSGSSTTYAPSPTTARPSPTATAPAAAPAAAPTTAAAPTVLSPAARAVAGAGAIAHGVSKGLRGETGSSKSGGGTGNGGRGRSGGGRGAAGSSRGMTRAEIEQAAKDAARKLDTTKARTGATGTAGKGGGVSKAELMKMIEDAKKRVATERKPAQRGVQRAGAGRAARPRATTLDAMRAGKEGEGAGSPKFLDVATTTPGVARPDSETSGSKAAAAAGSSSPGAGAGGGGRGMGMMPMGGMMGAMNRMGQGGPGGPGGPGGGGSSVEVPTDYNLDEVGKRSVDSVAGGVIRSAGLVPDDDDIVSPIQRAAEEPEGDEDAPKKRGLGNIFG